MRQENINDTTAIKDSIQNLINKSLKDSNFGKFRYSVNTHSDGGMLCAARVRNEHSLVVDEKPILGGCDLGVSPVELILIALGTCQEIMYSVVASTMNIELEECGVKLNAELDIRGMLGVEGESNACPGFSNINYVTKLRGNASDEQMASLIRTVEKQCPVSDMLTRKVSISNKIFVNDQDFGLVDKGT